MLREYAVMHILRVWDVTTAYQTHPYAATVCEIGVLITGDIADLLWQHPSPKARGKAIDAKIIRTAFNSVDRTQLRNMATEPHVSNFYFCSSCGGHLTANGCSRCGRTYRNNIVIPDLGMGQIQLPTKIVSRLRMLGITFRPVH